MDNPMLLAAAALLFAGPVLGEGLKESTFDVDSTLCRDDFEKTAVRSGNPKIVKGVVSNGLLSPTKQAVYATDDELSVRLPRERYRLPDAARTRRPVKRAENAHERDFVIIASYELSRRA